MGAFCTAYPVSLAIETFLNAVYEPYNGMSARSDVRRYTYIPGSTTGGMLVYNDLYAYSRHATDPAGGGHCRNAFDLVRIHMYGHRDAGCPAEGADQPSFKAMLKLAADDNRVLAAVFDRNRAEMLSVITDETPDAPAVPAARPAWDAALKRKKNGEVVATSENILTILNNCEGIAGHIHLDLMRGHICVTGGLPWDKTATRWDDRQEAALRVFLDRRWGLVGKDKIRDAFDSWLLSRTVHPVREYLNALKWDGVPRLETMIIDYLGAEDTPFIRAVTAMHMRASVARVMEPGVKYDSCVILQGPQGCGKSALISMLGAQWAKDGITTMEGKEAADPSTLLRKNAVDFVLNTHFATATLESKAFVIGAKTLTTSTTTKS